MKSYVLKMTDFIGESDQNDPYRINVFVQRPEFKQILAMGYRFESSPRQIQNGTLCLKTDSGFELLFMAKSLYVRKHFYHSDRSGVIIQYKNITLDEYWENVIDLVLNKIDITTSLLKKESKIGNRDALRGIITKYIDSLGLPTDISTLFKKYISYKNINDLETEILHSLQSTIKVEDKAIYLNLKDSRLKINAPKIVEFYSNNEYSIYISSSSWDARYIEAAIAQRDDAQVTFTHESMYRADFDGNVRGTRTIITNSWATDPSLGEYKIYVKHQSDDTLTLLGPTMPPDHFLAIDVVNSANATLRLQFNYTGKVNIYTDSVFTLQSNLDVNSINVHTNRDFRRGTSELLGVGHNQYKVKFETLDGAQNHQHRIDVDLSDAINDLW